jgi:hypothetical protein
MTISASIGKGKGRVENVTDVIQAHFILEDLKTKKGVTYTNAQLERLAHGITFIRNQRYLDPRFRIIDQLSMLDSTLSTIGIAPEKDIKYFTSINDNWLYAQNLSRGTGKRWTYLYTPSIDIFGDRDKDLRRYSYLYNADSVLSNNSYQYDLTNRQSINNAFEVHYYSATQKSWKVQQGFSATLQAAGKLQADYYRDTTSESEFLKPKRGQNDPSYSITPQASLYLSWIIYISQILEPII